MKNSVSALILVHILSTSPTFAAESPGAPKKAPPGVITVNCTTTREYVTTLEYLRSKKEFAIPEAEAQKIATKVSAGCTGAAQRFIKVSFTLAQAGLTANDAIKNGLEFAARADNDADAFTTIFKKAFLPEYLDLDIRSALEMARSLTSEFDTNVLSVRDDFNTLLNFCVNTKSLDLPRPTCGSFAVRLAKLGQPWSGGISSPFISAYEFIRSENGPALATVGALKLAEQLVAQGPGAPDNFIQAYRYAISKQGLGVTAQAALNFAHQMALTRSIPLKEE